MPDPMRIALAVSVVATSLVAAVPARAADVVAPFVYTGTEQQFVVPAGVRSVRVVAVGGHGGRGRTSLNNGAFVSVGGAGARTTATLPVTSGQTLFVTVAGSGGEQYVVNPTGAFGGGGALNDQAGRTSGGGGGASDVRTCAAAKCQLTGGADDPRLLVAGGGGGGGSAFQSGGGTGGNAGAPAQGGGAGAANAGGGGGQGGGAGTDTAGGTAGVAGIGTQTLVGASGAAGSGGASQAAGYTTQPGGGGGGGWFGGGSGGNGAWTNGQVGAGGGGGAGSSHVTATASDVQIADDASGTPSVTISYTPDTTPPQVSIGAPADGATYTVGQRALADYTCVDPAGVSLCDGDVAAGAALDTATAGEHTFTVHATDAAGNTQSRTVRYTVAAVAASPPPASPPPAGPSTVVAPGHAPALTLAARRRSLNTVLSSRGFLVSVRCDVRCDVRASAKVGGKTVGTGSGNFNAATSGLLRVKLTKSALRTLRSRRSATFVITVRATATGLSTTKTVRFSARRDRNGVA